MNLLPKSIRKPYLLAHLWFLLLAISGLLPCANGQLISYEFTNFSMGSTGALSFTTNNFTSIGIGADNRIWAGSQYGGLYYMEDDGIETWLKSDMLTSVFINDIDNDPNGGIWIAQSGTQSGGGNSNLGGALHYLPTKYATDMQLYTIPGALNGANLFSRNVRSIYVDKSYSLLPGRLPRVWIAQGTFITGFNTQRGGVNYGMYPTHPKTIRNVQGFSLLSNTPICESVDGNGTEIWVGVRLNQGRSSILRYKFNGDLIEEYNHLNTPAFINGFFPNAIHFDKNGYKWVGLREGGLRVMTPANEWVTVNMPTIFPTGTQINHNAITSDDLGNVYIGTSNGLVIFKSPDYFGTHPANPDGYTRLTTVEGLVNNGVKGMAFDAKHKRLIIATAGGISFLKTRPDKIVGTVFNAAAGLDEASRPGSDLLKSTPTDFRVLLLKGNTVVDDKTITGQSVYELENANNEDTYSIEIRYPRKNGKTMVYTLNNIKNQSFVPSVMVPDKLLTELDSLKPKLAKQCFQYSAIFGMKFPESCSPGFNISNFDMAGTRFRESDNLTEGEKLQLNNLANYLTALQAANKMGGQANEIEAEGWVNLIELIQYALEELALGQSLKDYVPEDKNPLFDSNLSEESMKILVGHLKVIKEGSVLTLKKVISKYPANAEVKKNMETALTILGDAIDIMITLVESGKNRTVFETLFAQLKKALVQILVAKTHEEFYLEERHPNLVPLTSNQSLNKVSQLDFNTVFNNVYNPGNASLVGVAQTQLEEKKQLIETAVSISNVSGAAADISDAASALALIPGAQIAGGIFKALSIGAKLVKGTALLTGTSLGILGSKEIRDSSEMIRQRAGFEDGGGGGGQPAMRTAVGLQPLGHSTLSGADSINARTIRLNQKLAALNVFYQSGTWQPVPFGSSYKLWRTADSSLADAINDGLLKLQPYLDQAFENISGYETLYKVTVDSFMDRKASLNRSLYYRTLAWMHVDNPATESAGLDSLVDDITILNDTIANRLSLLIDQLNNSSVEGGAYLEKTNWAYNHTHAPGSNGSVQFTFKNVGPVAMQNVRFLLKPLTAGYILNSPDSVFGGNVAPGGSIQYSFQFTSPQTDSLGRYQLEIIADNGRTPGISGSLIVVNPNKVFSIKDGNWSHPSTWHNGVVPLNSNDVQVGHKVVVNQNITCKSLTVTISGDLQVSSGKTVKIQP